MSSLLRSLFQIGSATAPGVVLVKKQGGKNKSATSRAEKASPQLPTSAGSPTSILLRRRPSPTQGSLESSRFIFVNNKGAGKHEHHDHQHNHEQQQIHSPNSPYERKRRKGNGRSKFVGGEIVTTTFLVIALLCMSAGFLVVVVQVELFETAASLTRPFSVVWLHQGHETLFPRVAYLESDISQMLTEDDQLPVQQSFSIGNNSLNHVAILHHVVQPPILTENKTHAHHHRHHLERRHHRSISYPMVTEEYLEVTLQRSKDYRLQPEPLETGECEPRYTWQAASRPTCNTLHEMDVQFLTHRDNSWSTRVKLLANGYYSDIWKVTLNKTHTKNNSPLTYHHHPMEYKSEITNSHSDKNVGSSSSYSSLSEIVVLKTLRYRHDISSRNIDRNRRDSVSMERLTKSKYVVNTYGYCSIASIVEYSEEGDLSKAIWPWEADDATPPTPIEKLRLATQGAMGLAAVHNSDEEGVAAIAHTDIQLSQFIFIKGRLKLNDFNRARFLLKSKNNTSSTCPYHVGKNPGKWRSPEEYEYQAQSEKVDVYSYGNVIYTILSENYPFTSVSSEDARKKVIKGIRPPIYKDIWESKNPAIKALKQAMMWCHEHYPERRASARKISEYLKAAMKKMDPGTLESWGDV